MLGGPLTLTPAAIAAAMLSRRGASENTCKRIQERHPYRYHLGFGVNEREKQDIANPAIKALDVQRRRREVQRNRLYTQHTKSKASTKKDGTPRANSMQQRIAEESAACAAELAQLKADRDQLPERVDVGAVADYHSFKAIDNEGRNRFDCVTASVWNARHQLIDWLQYGYAKDSDRVDLLYAILHCHGWIRSDGRSVWRERRATQIHGALVEPRRRQELVQRETLIRAQVHAEGRGRCVDPRV